MAHSFDLPNLSPDAPADEVGSAVDLMLRDNIRDSGDAWLDEDLNWKLTVQGCQLVAVCGGRTLRISIKAEE